MRRFELVEGSSSKFWEIELDGWDVTVRFGRIGTQGQAKTKSLASDAAARKEQAAQRDARSFEAVFERFVELHVKQNTKEGRFARDRAAAICRCGGRSTAQPRARRSVRSCTRGASRSSGRRGTSAVPCV